MEKSVSEMKWWFNQNDRHGNPTKTLHGYVSAWEEESDYMGDHEDELTNLAIGQSITRFDAGGYEITAERVA